jgi:two-component sensor histidine kinase
MTKHIAPLRVPDGSLLLRELNHRVNNELTSAICTFSAKAVESDDVAVRAAFLDVVDLLHGYTDVHKALRMPGSSSSWEMTAPRKELNMEVVSNSGGLFTGDR